ncbi:TIGR00341 family protein [Thiohalobacter sp. IOR34]|uniref:TIGR00341 family protein n=1 Tax=Thiohalobacter sp. IOR34 TaxID=3057176 RepID=UPI0025AF0FAA|nr:TIGR00341 family protein [Thiohalobacter sp. IOR34]WJW75554.1 TIGR00341 family protein [Thiohalobacter sp. IOR34]
MRIIEVVADAGHTDSLSGIARQHGALDLWWSARADDGRRAFRILVSAEQRQAVVDALQSLIGSEEGARILILPVDAVLPQAGDEEPGGRKTVSATREELYAQIERGARLDSNYLWMVLLSTLVAAIGLIEDNVAVVVGAMVIAPLLGPNIALAFATSLGDNALLWQSFKTELAGLGLALGVSLLIGVLLPLDLDSHEILARTDVGLDGVVVALASGAAAVLSLTAGLSTVLVGVMVAVALLPPTATLGLMLGSGQQSLAAGAALLLAVNVVCVILAAKLVFLAKGVKPRTWLEKRQARQSTTTYFILWAVLLAILVGVIYLRSHLR